MVTGSLVSDGASVVCMPLESVYSVGGEVGWGVPEEVTPSSVDGSVDFGSVGSSEVGSSEDIGSVVGSFCSVDGRHARPTHGSVVDSPAVGSVDSIPGDSVNSVGGDVGYVSASVGFSVIGSSDSDGSVNDSPVISVPSDVESEASVVIGSLVSSDASVGSEEIGLVVSFSSSVGKHASPMQESVVGASETVGSVEDCIPFESVYSVGGEVGYGVPEVVAPSSDGSVSSSEVGSSDDIGSVVGSFCSVDGRHARPTHGSVVDSSAVGSVDFFPSDSVVGISEGVLSSPDSVAKQARPIHVSVVGCSVLSVSNGSVVPSVLAGPLVRSSVGCVVGGLDSVLKQFPSGPQESVVIVGKTSGVSVASFSSFSSFSSSSSSSSSLHGGFSAFSS